MKRNLLFILVALLPLVASAYDAEIDGLYYNFSGDEATVTSQKDYWMSNKGSAYSGDVVIPSSVTYNGTTYSVTGIGSYAFEDCSGLTSVTIPNSVTSIGGSAFSKCTGLTSINIPDGVTKIDSYTFFHCSSLTTITIPNSVTSIVECAFIGCSGLTSVTIPNSLTSIGHSTFAFCSSLTSINIPNSVTNIGDGAFYNCSGLTSVTIPNSVTIIGNDVFSGCSGLTSVTIPYSVTRISSSAFKECSGLTSVTIPNSVTSIGSYAFCSCSGLTSVTIGSGVQMIGYDGDRYSGYTFANCQKLTDVYCYAENVPSTRNDAFEDSYIENATLHVPTGLVEKYKATAPWNSFGNIVEMTTSGKLLPFVQDGKVWTYEVSNFIHDWEETFSLEGDTVIGSRNCLKLYYSCQVYNQNRLYKGAMFEEGGNVYIIVPDSTTPLLMYDFSCEPETIIKVGEFKLKIKEKKLVKYHDEYLRVIDYTIPENEDYPFEGVEGVGFLGGGLTCLLDGYAPGSTGGERYLKTCTLNGVVVYEQHDFYTSAQIVTEDPVTYTKDQIATIILPTEPDASKGKYYRLDRCEDNQIIFEQELQPRARVPYIIVPAEDFSIDPSALNLEGLHSDTVSVEGVSFIGSYVREELPTLTGEDGVESSYIDFIDTTPDCGPSISAETGKESLLIGTLRAYLIVKWDDPIDHGSPSVPPFGKKEIVLKDFKTEINSLTPDPSPRRREVFDLQGRRLSGKPAKGVYINDGKKYIAR